jgi:uncharacterized protein with HEPN domain
MDEFVIKCLFDIQESIISIESYLGDSKNFMEYKSNKILRRAVEREFEIIGEALNRINKIQKIEIQFFQQIISLRNKIIHSYDNVDDIIMWGIITKHLPVLKLEIENLLNL